MTKERLDHLAGLAAAGKLKAPHIETFPLEEAGEAVVLVVIRPSGGGARRPARVELDHAEAEAA